MKSLINWEELLSLKTAQHGPKPGSDYDPGVFWDKQAPMYDQMAKMEKAYTRLQIDAIPTSQTDTVLDLCCGPGRVTSMIAPRVKQVTAVDASPKMLEYCQMNCEALGISNVTTQLMNWNDIVLDDTVKKHDIVIASRSVAMQDIKKLNQLANKAAVIICWANGPHIPVILEDMFKNTSDTLSNRPGDFRNDRRLGYNVTFNMVYDLGLDPNISVIDDGFTKTYPSYEATYADLRQLRPFADDKLPIFKSNLEAMLTKNNDGTVTFLIQTKSFVLWWRPKHIDEINN
ncbi:class I SAM-dependent methyltransferase [Acetobacterium carbinolicum]|uniref:class I SAM-dependent methyltransferase n=1 Tax=Acetobacterium carbinolicum TaxID=52690 RepID=UPI0039BF9FEB